MYVYICRTHICVWMCEKRVKMASFICGVQIWSVELWFYLFLNDLKKLIRVYNMIGLCNPTKQLTEPITDAVS